MNVYGVPFKVCLYLALHPGEDLSTPEIAAMFGGTTGSVTTNLKPHVATGYLVKRQGEGGRGNASVYSAGPRLQAHVERNKPAMPRPAPRRLEQVWR